MKSFTITGEKGTRMYLGGALFEIKKPGISNTIFAILGIILLILAPLQTTAQNIRGVAPVQTPLGGFAVDGNAYVNLPVSGDLDGGDLFFERGTNDNTAYPGGLFRADYFQNPPVPLGNGVFTDVTNPDLFVHPNTFLFRDDITNNDPTIFTSTNKINDNPNTYTWGPGSSPNKNEIQSALAHFTWGDPELDGNPGDLWMIFAADREVTNGSSYIDFEILQNTLTKIGTTSGSFESAGPDGGRTIGDILVTIEFTQGGGQATAVIRRWNGSSYVVYTGFPDKSIYISNNTVATVVPYSIYNQDPLASGEFEGYYQYSINQWAEGAVNITALFGPGNPCFNISTLFVRTRTSGSSGQSELKDFPIGPIQLNLDLTPDSPVIGSVENCGPWEGTLDATECEGTVKWYDVEFDGELLYTGASYDPGEISETTSFWVSCTVNGCEGPRAEVTVTIYDIPDFDVTNLDSCEDGETGGASFDLNDAISNDDPGTLSFYLLEADAIVPQNAISDPTDVTVLLTDSPETFWARLDNDDDGDEDCHTIKSFTVTVYDNPDLVVKDLSDCEEGETGFQSFDLNDAVTTPDGNITFYPTEDDAINETNALTEMEAMDVSVPVAGATYWVRSENTDDPTCYTIESFDITVTDNPDLVVTDLDDCEEGTTGAQTFDLNDAVTDDGGGDLSFYESELDANNEDNAIADPTAVSVSIAESPKTFWVRSENETNEDCFSVESFTVTVYDNPDVTTSNPEPICLGESVNLANYVTDADGGTLSYHSTLEDAEDGMNELMSTIVSPGLGSHDYFVRSENTSDSECYSVATITVTVITCDDFEGCTLGYWKTHTDRWCDVYLTCDIYGEIFMDAPAELADLTLLEVLNLTGGGVYNLGRQSVAALLNACTEDVNYELATPGDVIDYVVANFGNAGEAGSYLDMLNQAGCPLDGTPATTEPSEDCINGAASEPVSGDTNEQSVEVNGFNVSPVPFRESLNVQYDFDYVSNAVIQMYDMQGRLLSTQKEANASKGKVTNLSINFRTLPSQVYVIKVTTDRDVFTKKIVSDK
ncbi:T9SS type A sorting domain-containing protein [Antarcticibacterium arcticum]|uniref:T9SS type A sorting domain-containing protein n=1 Tax=Antarcticibacterium arcticum TaxID=2585771 RepID=A0A5B8YJP8_9FLAO|nr:T9SS type A sorting domain-containing protein [Antarcticibacterium arcticum]QED38152.1 T9SS type A sorting domain-containing protein [Antarcticibacterium arcticum]